MHILHHYLIKEVFIIQLNYIDNLIINAAFLVKIPTFQNLF